MLSIALLIIITVMAIIIMDVYPVHFPKKIKWSVDLRAQMPEVYKQQGPSCAICAMSALLKFKGEKTPFEDPDEWFNALGTGNEGLTVPQIEDILYQVSRRGIALKDTFSTIDAIKTGNPVLVAIYSPLDFIKGNIPLSMQHLGKLYTGRWSKNIQLVGHALLIVGISKDEEYFLLRDSNGLGIGDKGHWVMPVELLMKHLIGERCFTIQ